MMNNTRPGVSKVVAAPIAGARFEAQHQKKAMSPERHVDEEDRLPAERLGEIAAGDGPNVARRDRNAGEVTLIICRARAGGMARPISACDSVIRPPPPNPCKHASRGEEIRYWENRAKHDPSMKIASAKIIMPRRPNVSPSRP